MTTFLCDVAIVGASESVINYGTMKAWQAMHVLSPEGCFPFAKKRNGTVLAEGAGVLVLESEAHAKARGSVLEVDYPGIGAVKSANNPIKLSDAPVEVRRKSPSIGQHTVEIMREVGYSDSEVAALREAKAIAGP